MSLTFTIMMLLTISTSIFTLIILHSNMFLLIKPSLMNFMSLMLTVDIMLDWMSILFLTTVTLISGLIILFSKYYIPKKEHNQFILMLLMFVLSMSILILSNNLFLILLGWDGLGLSSYMLVVYYQNSSSSSSGTITLLSNRIGDIMILMSMGLITISSNWSLSLNKEYSLITLLLIMIAACSKSAQFPFSAWLPMAMAAPTPISALVHSSTLVTAGVFIMLRTNTHNHPYMLSLLMIISSSTAIYSSMSANWEQDLKKIIALSTLSQIAMMMFAISLKSITLAFLHLIIHALFKSAMFLCAGVMIHESTYQDTRMMGKNFINSPLTLSMLGINSMALMGIPFMSGFFSKDAIIEKLITSSINMLMLLLMTMSIGMTASYSIRMSFMSNKSILKSNSLSSNHQNIQSYIPILVLSLLAITSGSWLTWILSPEQTFMMNNSNKMIIMTAMTSGLLIGFSLKFKSKTYSKMGMPAISLWFTHIMSITPTNMLSQLMLIYHNTDKQWQENYGPHKYYNLLMMSSYYPEITKMSMMFTLILITLMPLFML